MSERKVTPPSGIMVRTTAASRALSMPAPVSSSSLTGTGAGGMAKLCSADRGMITKAGTPGSAGCRRQHAGDPHPHRLDGPVGRERARPVAQVGRGLRGREHRDRRPGPSWLEQPGAGSCGKPWVAAASAA